MKRAPSKQQLAALNEQFADVVEGGRIERIAITAAEARDRDAPGLERIAFVPRPIFGRIRQLIDALNQL